MEQQDRILGYFLEEADEHLKTIEQGLQKLPETLRQPEQIRELFRAAHSIVGSAAMLGLTDVQQVGKQFETNFKLLKEQPLAVDNRLQSLFLASFGFLRAAIVEVKTSSDPYRQNPAKPPSVSDAVFEELKSYIQLLLARVDAPTPTAERQQIAQDPAIEQVFGEYVTRKIRELQQLCLQPERSETRAQIQQICQKLGNLGENFEFLEWTNLFTACRLATANPLNSLHQLGESIGIAVKQSQILILADRHQAISITPDLQALIDCKDPVESTSGAASTTFKLDYATNPHHVASLERQSPKVGSSLSSLYEELTLNHPDSSEDFMGSISERNPKFDSEMELNEFIDLLGEDLPIEGTWMQDEDLSDNTLNRVDADNLAIVQSQPEHQVLEIVAPQSTPTPIVVELDPVVNIELPIITVDYDEETFYDPELDDPDLATFWSDTDIVAEFGSLDRLNELDFVDNNRHQFQPEHPPLQDVEAIVPDFTLDPPISSLFTSSLIAAESQVEDFQPEIAIDPATILSEQFITIDSIPDPIFSEDFDSSELSNFTIAEDNITSGLTWIDSFPALPQTDDRQNLKPDLVENHLSLNPAIDRDIAASLGGVDNLVVTDTAIDRDFSDLNLETIENPSDLQAYDLDLYVNPTIHQDSSHHSLDEIDNLSLFADLDIQSDLSDFNLDDIDSLDLSGDLATERDFAELNLANIDDLEPIAPVIQPDLSDFNLDDIDSLDLSGDLATERDFAELNLANIDDLEPIAPVIQPDLSDFNLDDIDSLDLSIDLATERDFAQLNLANINNLEDEQFSDLDFDIDLNSQLDDISDLDFGDDISSDQFLDLGQIVTDNLAASAELEDLDSLLLGTAAVGVGGAIGSIMASEFDDLDALVGTSSPSMTPDNSLNDLDSLLAAAPELKIVETTNNKKTTDRRSKQRTFEQTMRVSVSHLNNLNNLVGELVVNRNTLEQDQNRMRQFIEKLFSEVQKLNEVGKRMQDLYERSLMENSLIASRQQSKAANTNQSPVNSGNLDSTSFMEYDPLEMDRFTPIHLLSQKMIELTVRIRESTSDIEFVVDGSTEVTRTLRQITGQLQEDLTKSRMIPFAQTADRLQRGVRENGLKYGKQVELEIEGRDTPIDKVILESLTDPLIHMVNNAIAHGIESPQTRQKFDKPPIGKISIRALHQGNQTIISISDDGAGINTEIVKSKAIQKGIITAKQAATMTKPEVYELLFLPSFSTKDQADELAGRGVGMDVVRTSLSEIRGTISTESQVGLGTTFTIRLPLALSIAKALIAIDNKTNIAFPMDGIEDTQDVSPEQIQKNNQGENCIFWRDSLMPFKPLSDLLGFNRPLPRNNFYTTQEDETDLVSILILRSDGNLLAVQVDKITGEQEIAIKPLQGPASKPVGIAGATVMGDGRIIPIADVMELIDLAKGKITRHISTKWAMDLPAPTTQRQESMVLIVDDSITVRELLSLTFKRAGYRVEQARDGQEAWDKLRAGLPCDIVFCDIEMPRMDGLEFLSRVQKDPALSKVPVAMLTSRGSDRHRQIASQLGASGYFIKPYLEEALLHAAKRMIEGEVLAIV